MLNIRLGRREALKLGVALGFSGVWHGVWALGDKAGFESTLSALPAFVDVLIPRDRTPSATELNVHETLLGNGQREPMLHLLLTQGCRWLDEQADKRGGVRFADLEEADQIAVVRKAAGTREGFMGRYFFDRIRERAMAIYYARPESWPGSGFERPPQPVGYPDYAKPPGSP